MTERAVGGETAKLFGAPTGGALIAAVGAIYLALLPQNFTEGEDATYYAYNIKIGAPEFHPNHLLHQPAADLFVRAVGSLLPDVPTLVAMQALSVIATICALGILYSMMRRAGAARANSALAVLATAFSYAIWLYGGYPDTYALPLPFALAAVHLFVARLPALREGRGDHLAPWIGIGLLLGQAALIHQQHAFILPGLCLALLLGAVRGRIGALARCGVAMAGAFIVYVLATYFLVGAIVHGHHTPFETIAWARGLAKDGLWTPLSWLSPLKGLVGLGTAVWSPTFVFASPEASAFVARLFPGKLIVEEAYLAERAPTMSFWPILVLTVASGAAFGVLVLKAVWKFVMGLTAMPKGSRDLGQVLALCFVTIGSIVVIWEPLNKEFWILTIPFGFGALALTLDFRNLSSRVVAGTFVGGLFLGNLLGGAIPFADRDTDYWARYTRQPVETLRSRDVLLTDCGFICTGYLRLFSEAEVVRLVGRHEATGPADVPAEAPLYVDGSALEALQARGMLVPADVVLLSEDPDVGARLYRVTNRE